MIAWRRLSSEEGQLPKPPGSDQQTGCLIWDADKDGRQEFVITCRNRGPAVAWYRPLRQGWGVYTIEPDSIPIEAGCAAQDVTGNGAPDFIAGEDYQGGSVYWWENPWPHFAPETRWQRYVVKEGGAHQHHDLLAADLDGDGRKELVFWNQQASALYWAPIPRDPKAGPWPRHLVWQGSGEGLATADVDGDGRPELLAGGKWFKHRGGSEFTPYTIDSSQTHPRMAAADLDQDGQPEVVMCPGDALGRLRWYKCSGDPRRFEEWKAHDLLDRDVVHGHSLAIADFDGDGNLDIFCGEMRTWTGRDDHPNCGMWVFWGDGRGGFRREQIATGVDVHEGQVGDLDGDGRPDILVKPYNWRTPRVEVWLNLGGAPR